MWLDSWQLKKPASLGAGLQEAALHSSKDNVFLRVSSTSLQSNWKEASPVNTPAKTLLWTSGSQTIHIHLEAWTLLGSQCWAKLTAMLNPGLTFGPLHSRLTCNLHHVLHRCWPWIVECEYVGFCKVFILTVNFSTSGCYFHSNLLFFHTEKHFLNYIYTCFFPRLENLFSAKKRDSESLSRTTLLILVKLMHHLHFFIHIFQFYLK